LPKGNKVGFGFVGRKIFSDDSERMVGDTEVTRQYISVDYFRLVRDPGAIGSDSAGHTDGLPPHHPGEHPPVLANAQSLQMTFSERRMARRFAMLLLAVVFRRGDRLRTRFRTAICFVK